MKQKILLLILTVLTPSTFAATFLLDEVIHVEIPFADDVYSIGEEFNLKSDTAQDVYVLSESIRIEGVVGDDLHVAGENIDITRDVSGDVFGAGTYVRINDSTMGSDVYLVGAKISLSNATINGDLKIYAESIHFHNVSVFGNLKVEGKEIDLIGTNTVQGNLTYTDTFDANKIALFNVLGQITEQQPKKGGWDIRKRGGDIFELVVSLVMFKLFALFICGGIVILIAGKYVRNKEYIFTQVSFLRPFLVGLMMAIALPIVGIMLCFLGFTAPLGIFLLVVFLLYFVVLGEILAISYIYFLITSGKSVLTKICALICLCFVFSVISGLDVIVVWWAIGSLTLLKFSFLKKISS